MLLRLPEVPVLVVPVVPRPTPFEPVNVLPRLIPGEVTMAGNVLIPVVGRVGILVMMLPIPALASIGKYLPIMLSTPYAVFTCLFYLIRRIIAYSLFFSLL
jgi:hypothetical protein